LTLTLTWKENLMKRSKWILAAVIGGAMVIGCDRQEDTTTAPPAGPPVASPPPATLPTAAEVKEGARSATQQAGDALKSTTQPAK
jgi:hypothetical protein